ncbi:MAG: ABC transporter permease [Nitrospira sp.]|nr:ABC transporter permease [Nitrospira sp.]
MFMWVSIGILLFWIGMVLLGPLLTLNPYDIGLSRILSPPGTGAWLGYDDLGRPIWDRLVLGARTSLVVAICVVTISMWVGTFLGTVTAYLGRWWDHFMVRVIDIFLAFPGILLAIAMAGLMGPGIDNVVIALSTVGWVGFARLSRAQVLSLKHREHVQAAVALGAGRIRIVTRHLIPLMFAPLIVEATFSIAGVILAEAGLSFLGLGVQPPAPSWGSMIRDGARYMLVTPHMVLAPGVSVMLVVLAVNSLGDRLRDWMDVRTKRF